MDRLGKRHIGMRTISLVNLRKANQTEFQGRELKEKEPANQNISDEQKQWQLLRSDEYVENETKKESQLAPKPLWKALKENEEKKRLEESEKLRVVNFELDEDGRFSICYIYYCV